MSSASGWRRIWTVAPLIWIWIFRWMYWSTPCHWKQQRRGCLHLLSFCSEFCLLFLGKFVQKPFLTDEFAVIACFVEEVTDVAPVRSSTKVETRRRQVSCMVPLVGDDTDFWLGRWWRPAKKFGILYGVQQLLDFEVELLQCRLWLVLYFTQNTGANVGVFGALAATN